MADISWPDLTFPPINQPVLMDALSFEEQVKKRKESPCIQVCKVEHGVCTGCSRTLEEIRDWSTMTDDQRIKVKERINNAG